MGSRDPYCGNCRYSLVGCVDASKCPECGKPLVEVLERGPVTIRNRRYRSPVVVFGLPLVDVAFGPGEDGKPGRARGIIALGDLAVGWLAVGGFARGVIAIGGSAIGLVAFAGMALGGITFGGFSIGLIAIGGGAVGGVAFGGGSVGAIATGGGVIGYYGRGGGVSARYQVSPIRNDPEAVRLFAAIDRIALMGGSDRFSGLGGMVKLYVLAAFWMIAVVAIVGLPATVLVLMALMRQGRLQPRGP